MASLRIGTQWRQTAVINFSLHCPIQIIKYVILKKCNFVMTDCASQPCLYAPIPKLGNSGRLHRSEECWPRTYIRVYYFCVHVPWCAIMPIDDWPFRNIGLICFYRHTRSKTSENIGPGNPTTVNRLVDDITCLYVRRCTIRAPVRFNN